MAWPLPLDRIRVQAPAGRVILAATDKGTAHGATRRMTSRIRFSLISISSLLVFYILIGGLLGKNNSTGDRTYRDMGVYSEVLSRIKQDYVTEPNLKKVTDGAVRGLLEALDPYSTYLDPQEYQDYLQRPTRALPTSEFFCRSGWGSSLWSPCCREARRRKQALRSVIFSTASRTLPRATFPSSRSSGFSPGPRRVR